MADARYFAFTDVSDREFVFQPTDPDRIQEALDILSGKETNKVHVIANTLLRQGPEGHGFSHAIKASSKTSTLLPQA